MELKFLTIHVPTKMLEMLSESVLVASVVVFLMAMPCGGVSSYGYWQNEFKDRYTLSQTQGKCFKYLIYNIV